MLSQKEKRRHQRVAFAGAVRISWEDDRGLPKYATAKCLDLSPEGLRIEVSQSIPVRAILSLRTDQINFGSSASVLHAAPRGCKYILGLRLSQAIDHRHAALNPA
jgi:hypothetical protein